LPSDVHQARRNELRIIGDPDECVQTQSGGTVTHQIDIVASDYVAADRVGVELTPLSPSYFPGLKYLEPNIAVVTP